MKSHEDLYDQQVTDLMKQVLARNTAKEIAEARADVARQHEQWQPRRAIKLKRAIIVTLSLATLACGLLYQWGCK